MDRRGMLGVGIGAIATAATGIASPPGAVTVNVLRAGAVSRNGYVVPADVILKALDKLNAQVPCPLLTGERDGREIGTASNWRFRDGWLTGDLLFAEGPQDFTRRLESGELVCRPSTIMTSEEGDRPRRVKSLLRMFNVYLESPEMQSWTGLPACPSCGSASGPVGWFPDDNETHYRCTACGTRHKSNPPNRSGG